MDCRRCHALDAVLNATHIELYGLELYTDSVNSSLNSAVILDFNMNCCVLPCGHAGHAAPPEVYRDAHFAVQETPDVVYGQGLACSASYTRCAPMDLKLDVYAPRGAPGRRPAYILMHGGGARCGSDAAVDSRKTMNQPEN